MKIYKTKSRMSIITSLMIMVVLLSAGTSKKQSSFTMSQESELIVSGTSSLHDWEMDVTKLNGSAAFTIEQGDLASIEQLKITIPVKSLKSGKSGMDDNAYEALNASKHPNITYRFKEIVNQQSGQLKTLGNLTIAGVSKQMEIPVKYQVRSGSKVQFTGDITFKMSAFDVDPPKAMWGTIKTGDEVKLAFDASFIQ